MNRSLNIQLTPLLKSISLRRGAIFGVLTITGFGASNALRGLAMRPMPGKAWA